MEHNRPFEHSVRDALRGIAYTIKTERNFRLELVGAFVVLCGSFFVPLTMPEKIGAWIVVFFVLCAELFNTAIERAVDVAMREENAIARHAKDTAAAAVFVVSIGAFFYGCFLVWNIVQRVSL